jgi:hypothetical protein
MQTLRRTVGLLIFPAIAYLGAACERTNAPTEGKAVPPISAVTYPAATRWVNSSDLTPNAPGTSCMNAGYTTISAALVGASPVDVIQVCPGPYTENDTIKITNLTLLGAQAGTPVAMRTFGDPLSESTVTGASLTASVPVFQVAATNVTIDGFSVRNMVVSGDAFGIGVKVTGSYAVIANNIVHMVTTPDPNGAAQAIYLQNGPDHVSILGNDLKYVQSNKSAKGVFVGDAASTDPSMSILIEGNSITNITSVQVPTGTPARGAYGILFNNGSNLINGTNNTGLEIRNNTINNLSSLGWVHAIGLEANTPGVLVRDNSISALVSPSLDLAAVFFEANQSYSTGKVNQNNFDVTPLAYGIELHPLNPGTGDVDGTCNWWGDPTGPSGPGGSGAGAKVSTRVAFIPWLLEPAPSRACRGGAPSGGTVSGGGQIDVMSGLTSGVGSFGFSANAARQSGHLDYLNHVSSTHLNCTVNVVMIDATKTKAHLGGTCRSNNYTGNFTADVEDNADPGKNADKFQITYSTIDGAAETIRSGNIQIH